MIITNGDWLPMISDDNNNAEYTKSVYGIDNLNEYIQQYGLIRSIEIYPSQFRFIAFIDEYATINCLLTLEDRENEHLIIYSEDSMGDDILFVSDAMPIIKLIRDNKLVASFLIENESYQFNASTNANIKNEVYEKIKQINSHRDKQYEITDDNVLIICQH